MDLGQNSRIVFHRGAASAAIWENELGHQIVKFLFQVCVCVCAHVSGSLRSKIEFFSLKNILFSVLAASLGDLQARITIRLCGQQRFQRIIFSQKGTSSRGGTEKIVNIFFFFFFHRV